MYMHVIVMNKNSMQTMDYKNVKSITKYSAENFRIVQEVDDNGAVKDVNHEYSAKWYSIYILGID